jgi:hypothetical protein
MDWLTFQVGNGRRGRLGLFGLLFGLWRFAACADAQQNEAQNGHGTGAVCAKKYRASLSVRATLLEDGLRKRAVERAWGADNGFTLTSLTWDPANEALQLGSILRILQLPLSDSCLHQSTSAICPNVSRRHSNYGSVDPVGAGVPRNRKSPSPTPFSARAHNTGDNLVSRYSLVRVRIYPICSIVEGRGSEVT